ncbi:MAG: 7-carboxy-7-deazaguanine synthase QueE [Euryarchaeota archaeon]|nr:7-carboxy-7-deazaguanine synthase QueE [Euryarchaeota archaeon]
MAYIYEAFSSIQGEGIYVGKRQVFLRFAGCPLRCIYCDTKYAYEIPKRAKIIMSDEVKYISNPISPKDIVEIIKALETPDMHSVSFTGGEPLIQEDLEEVLREVKKEGYRTFLETACFPYKKAEKIVKYIDIASVDIKLPSHRAHPDPQALISHEKRCIETFVKSGIETYVKVVVLPETSIKELENALLGLENYNIEIVLQPVMIRNLLGVNIKSLIKMSEKLGEKFRGNIRVLPQVHKLLKLR